MVTTTQERARRRALALLAVALVAPGRAAALMAGDPPDSPTRRLDPNRTDSPFAAVGSLTRPGGGVYSSVLLTRRHVLTAGHVVPPDPGELTFNLNLGRDLSHSFAIRHAHRHPQFKGFVPPNPPNDLALLELDGDAPAGITLPALAPVALAPGNVIELVGYGASGSGSKGVTAAANAALKRVGLNVVDRVAPGDASAADRAALYFFTFDAPVRPPYAGSRSLGNARETGLASGDSGSPAFVVIDGRRWLAGINTFVQRRADAMGPSFGFGTIGGGQILHGQRDWIRSILGQPG